MRALRAARPPAGARVLCLGEELSGRAAPGRRSLPFRRPTCSGRLLVVGPRLTVADPGPPRACGRPVPASPSRDARWSYPGFKIPSRLGAGILSPHCTVLRRHSSCLPVVAVARIRVPGPGPWSPSQCLGESMALARHPPGPSRLGHPSRDGHGRGHPLLEGYSAAASNCRQHGPQAPGSGPAGSPRP